MDAFQLGILLYRCFSNEKNPNEVRQGAAKGRLLKFYSRITYYLKPAHTIRFQESDFFVPIGSCEHDKNDLPTDGSVIFKNRMEIGHALQVYVLQNIRKIYFLHKISRTRF